MQLFNVNLDAIQKIMTKQNVILKNNDTLKCKKIKLYNQVVAMASCVKLKALCNKKWLWLNVDHSYKALRLETILKNTRDHLFVYAVR